MFEDVLFSEEKQRQSRWAVFFSSVSPLQESDLKDLWERFTLTAEEARTKKKNTARKSLNARRIRNVLRAVGMDNSPADVGLHLNYVSLCKCQHRGERRGEVKAIITHLFSFIHGLQNGHVQLFQSRQDVDIFPQMWSEVLWRRGRSVERTLCVITNVMVIIRQLKQWSLGLLWYINVILCTTVCLQFWDGFYEQSKYNKARITHNYLRVCLCPGCCEAMGRRQKEKEVSLRSLKYFGLSSIDLSKKSRRFGHRDFSPDISTIVKRHSA